ncbi:MAG: ComF family protein [Verrucomicrobiae bacterium]|nr:ComF family protein [Verrucomicrobiae bacterium]
MDRSKTKGYERFLDVGRTLIGLIWPRACLVCDHPIEATNHAAALCVACQQQIPWIEPPFCERCGLPFAGAMNEPFQCEHCRSLTFHFRYAVAAVRAEGVPRQAIHRLKYERRWMIGPVLAEWLIKAARTWVDWNEVDGIVPIPLHPRKKKIRQFNQAEWLADALSQVVARPVIRDAVVRVRDTPTQTLLGREARARNLRDAFAVRKPKAVAGQRLVLVDDVFTTGVTMDACAKVLRDAQAADVVALTVARGV